MKNSDDFQFLADPSALVALLKAVMLLNPRVRLTKASMRAAEQADIHVARDTDGSLLLSLVPGNGSPDTKITLV